MRDLLARPCREAGAPAPKATPKPPIVRRPWSLPRRWRGSYPDRNSSFALVDPPCRSRLRKTGADRPPVRPCRHRDADRRAHGRHVTGAVRGAYTAPLGRWEQPNALTALVVEIGRSRPGNLLSSLPESPKITHSRGSVCVPGVAAPNGRMEEPSSSPIVFCIGALVIAACSGPALKEEFRRPDPSYSRPLPLGHAGGDGRSDPSLCAQQGPKA